MMTLQSLRPFDVVVPLLIVMLMLIVVVMIMLRQGLETTNNGT
jgi:hypothetical protein